jgi:hypothetical protein
LRLVAGGWFVLREKYYWLVADKPSEQDNPAEYTCISKFSMEVAAVKKETKYKRLLRSSGRTKMLSCRYLN